MHLVTINQFFWFSTQHQGKNPSYTKNYLNFFHWSTFVTITYHLLWKNTLASIVYIFWHWETSIGTITCLDFISLTRTKYYNLNTSDPFVHVRLNTKSQHLNTMRLYKGIPFLDQVHILHEIQLKELKECHLNILKIHLNIFFVL